MSYLNDSSTDQATPDEISRLLYNAYKIAIVHCDLSTAIYRVSVNEVYTGESIRHMMPILFEERRLSENLKEHLRVYWILPTCFRLLRSAGYQYEYTIKLLNNITSAEAIFLARSFSAMASEAEIFWEWRMKHMKAGA